MLNYKKSQLSIFIIIGIIVVLMLILAFILSFSFFNTTLRQNIIASSTRKSIATQIETTIQDCLQTSAEKALLLVGQQGGYIYSYQGGLTELPITILGTNITRQVYVGTEKFDIPFWIIRDPIDNPPAYPRYDYYGLPIIVYLQPEDIKTSNKKIITIKEQLENYATLKFQECFNISRLNQSIRAKIYEKEKPKIKVTFSRKNTRFELEYPIIIYDRQMNNKVYTSDVRFVSIYSLLRMLLEREMKNLTFTFTEDGMLINPYKGTIGIEKIKGTVYDVGKIIDSKARINNKPYEFVFLMQNRNPVLQNIPIIELFIDESYDFSPFAFDPDEDVLSLKIKNKRTNQEINNSVFYAFKEFIGTNEFIINVTDTGNLSDWQDSVIINVKCQYFAPNENSGNVAFKINNENWSFNNQIFSYNPHCCDPTTQLSFRAGEKAKMKIPNTNEICDCTCTQLGDCINPQCGSENCCYGFGDCECKETENCEPPFWIHYNLGNNDQWCRQRFGNRPYCCKFERFHDPELSMGHDPELSEQSCFPAGVLVLMADWSYKPIEDVVPGDVVVSYDFENKKFSVSKVLEVESPIRDNLCVVRFNDSSFLNVTWDHPIFTLKGIKSIIPEYSAEREELNITQLSVGDDVYAFDKTNNKTIVKKVVSINCNRIVIKTYNLLNLTPHNNYFADNVLVHNEKCVIRP
ncbi:MAG: Hint domain-containing protein [Candidatus Woesearchaeota archaeon]